MGKQTERTSKNQRSYIHANPTHALAGLIKCKCCNGAMVRVNGKGGGYYGCYNAKRKSCTNKLIIPRKRVEAIILNDLREKFLTVENLKYIYENVEKMIAKTLNKNPKAAALALKELLGTIELEPVKGECVVENGQLIESRSYYVAHTSIQTLALLDEEFHG